MKKIIAILLLLGCALSFTGCKRKNQEVGSPPPYTYLYNTSEAHKAIGEYIQSLLASAGLTVKLTNQEWGTFLSTRKSGNYTLARNGWIADYSDPISFLDMWTSHSGSNDIGFGKGEHASVSIYDIDLQKYGYDIKVENGNWSETYDRLIDIIKHEKDNEKRYELMHMAEDMIMSTGCIMPIYYYTDIYMLDSDVDGFYSSPLGNKYFTYCTVAGKDNISVCLSSEPESLDPAHNTTVDGSTMLAHLFSGIARWSTDNNGNPTIVPDCAEFLPEGIRNEDGSVSYTYRLREGLRWSDGRALTAHDFEYAWKRAADPRTAAEYGYMFEIIKGYGESDADSLAVNAIDDRTLEVTLASPIAYFNELLAFPAYYPVREDVVQNESWSTKAESYVGNGPYTMTDRVHNSYITLTKNENYIDKDTVMMPSIKFFLSDDSNNMLTNFKNRTWQLIDDVPTNEIPSLKAAYPDEFFVAGQIGTYYIAWNINADILGRGIELSKNESEIAKSQIRSAINLLIDRNYICDTIGQSGQVPASSFVAMGIKNPDGSEFYKTAGSSESYVGYFDTSAQAYEENVRIAVEILRKHYNTDELNTYTF